MARGPSGASSAAAVSDETAGRSDDGGLDHSRMRFVLQPVVESATGQVAFYECLTRVEQSDGALSSAGASIQSAERAGHAHAIDLATLDMAVALLKQHDGLKLSLNISGLTCSDPLWLSRYLEMTGDDAGLAERLLIEITETAAIDDMAQSIAFVCRVQQQGSRVAIDDFGAGHTSFEILKELNADVVKIDGALVENIETSDVEREFLRCMVTLADACEMETVA
ncbi:MAG: EAL domain-containing protein, partial [Hyphomicrobiaceae bacterium]